MNRTMQRIFVGLTIMLLVGLATGGTREFQLRPPSTESGQSAPVARPFKLKAAGQIDLATGTIIFGGVATHLGLYEANGYLNADFSILGTIEAANGDLLHFTAFFSTGPMGEIQATFQFSGGTGRFAGAAGDSSGPVTLDPDFTFLLKSNGHLDY